MTDTAMANDLKLTDDPEARRLVSEAHARMYKWPKEFGGYRADVARMIMLSNHEVME